MFSGFWGWLSEFDGRVSFFVIPVQEVEKGADWNWVWPTLVGGMISLLASVSVILVTTRTERKVRREEENKRDAAAALSGYYKISQWVNLVANIKLHIDESYSQAESIDISNLEPFQIVGPAAGQLMEPERLSANELRFLFTKDHFALVDSVTLIEQRAANLLALLTEYSKQKLAFDIWIENLKGVKKDVDGPMVGVSIPTDQNENFEMRAGQLNILLGGIIEDLDADLESFHAALQAFVDAARDVLKDDFPKLELELKGGRPKPRSDGGPRP